MSTIPWSTILAAAERAARLLPPPLNIVSDVALVIARGYLAAGCTLDGCPPAVEADVLARARRPIPAGDEASARARAEARKRVAGLDRASVRARLDAPHVPSAFGDVRRPTAEHPDAAEVYGDDDDGA